MTPRRARAYPEPMGIKWGRLLIGASAAYVAIDSFRHAFERTDKAVGRLEDARGGGVPQFAKGEIRPAGRDIEQRARYIAEQVWRSSLHPEIKALAMETLNRKCDGKWCTPPREHLREVKTLAGAVYDPNAELWDAIEGNFAWVKENVAYRKDHAYVDQFPTAMKVKQYKGEDCDGHVVLVDALNLVSGFPVGMRIYATTNGNGAWDHIAGLAEIPPRSGRWYVMDASVDKVREGGRVTKISPGWGAPPQMVRRYVDYQILPGGKVQKIATG